MFPFRLPWCDLFLGHHASTARGDNVLKSDDIDLCRVIRNIFHDFS